MLPFVFFKKRAPATKGGCRRDSTRRGADVMSPHSDCRLSLVWRERDNHVGDEANDAPEKEFFCIIQPNSGIVDDALYADYGAVAVEPGSVDQHGQDGHNDKSDGAHNAVLLCGGLLVQYKANALLI